MKRIGCIILGLLFILQGFSQVAVSDSVQKTFKPRKFNVHLSLGSQFSSYGSYGSEFSSIVSPTVTYDVSKRFRLQGGFSIINTNYFGLKSFFSEQNSPAYNGNCTSAILFFSGQYLLSNKITITGSAFKEFPLMGDPPPYSPYQLFSKEGAQGIRMDVNYKIGENFQIQAGFGYSKGVNMYYSPFGRSMYNNNDPFGLMPGW